MEVFKSLVQPFVGNVAGNSVVDGMKLVVLGGTVETARRVSSSAWYVPRTSHSNHASLRLPLILVQIFPLIIILLSTCASDRSSFVNC